MKPEPFPHGHALDDPAGSGAAYSGPAGGEPVPAGTAVTGAGPGGRQPGALQRGRLRFRGWRRSRPFWGGLLLILAGSELLLLPLMGLLTHSAFKVIIYIGIGGVFGVLIGGLLIACGLLAWFHPVQRIFYGIVGALLSIASFPATNLGGFFLGMLFGVFGASLVFAWSPARPHHAGRRRRRGAPAEPAGGIGDVLGEPGAGQPSRRGRLLALPVVPLLLFGTLTPGQAPALARQAAPAGSSCLLPSILSFLCPPPPPSGQASGAAPAASPGSTVSPSPTVSPLASASPAVTVPPSPSPSATGPSPAGTGSPTPSPGPSVNPNAHKRASAASALVAASSTATLTAGSALMVGLSYDGVATVPTANGSQQMLKFSMSSLTLSGGIVLTVDDNGHSRVTRNSSVHFSGNVVLYATKLSGDLLGIPLTFTPASPPPLVLPLMQFTNVVTGQPLTSAATMQATALDITG